MTVRIVVITHRHVVARWAAESIAFDDGNSMIVPIVIGPKEIPRIHEPGITPSPEAGSALDESDLGSRSLIRDGMIPR